MRLLTSIFREVLRPLLLTSLIIVSTAGCSRFSSTPTDFQFASSEKACVAKFTQHDDAISANHTADTQFARIPGFPFLRINRLLQSLSLRLKTSPERIAWVERLAALDFNARKVENNNLQAQDRVNMTVLDNCRTELVRRITKSTKQIRHLFEVATVQDSYSWAKRIAGLYPLSRWPVFRGVLKLHNQQSPLPHNKITEANRLYSSRVNLMPRKPTSLTVAQRDELGFPKLDDKQLEYLVENYSPIWSIEHDAESDLPGTLHWSNNEVFVETNSLSQYEHFSFALFENQPVLQLMFTIWFSAVPPSRTIDIYAGKIDGLTFRVTLDHNFEPLLVDVMHNCGCYYMAFPTPKLHPRSTYEKFDEPLWVPYELEIPNSGDRYIIQLRSGNHFVTGISVGSAQKELSVIEKLATLPYDSLRSLPLTETNNRSVFSPRGLIENSQRLERFLLWPMGVLSAGAMRQTGHHAIAFVGRRHFDDPDLINKHFLRK